MDFNYVYVTVGTTEFDELVKTISSETVLDTLFKLGYTKLLVQSGRGKYKIDTQKTLPIQIVQYNYKDSIEEDLRNASLVISHAGAGSILESLELKKRLIVVVNDQLMANHQYELAEKMDEEEYLYYCTCKDLNEVLKTKDLSKLKEMVAVGSNFFADYVTNYMNIIGN